MPIVAYMNPEATPPHLQEAAEARLEKATADAAGAQERVVSVEKSSSEERVALKKSRDYLKAVEDTLAQELEKGRLAVARAAEEESLAKSLREENVRFAEAGRRARDMSLASNAKAE